MASPTYYKCSNCNHLEKKWMGKCLNCDAWGVLEEQNGVMPGAKAPSSSSGGSGKGVRASTVATGNKALPVNKIALESETNVRLTTGINEYDRVLGSGMVPGSVMLLAGPPGTGKSSLALWVASKLANSGKRVLYITGEETANQVAARAIRIGATDTEEGTTLGENLYLVSEGNLQNAVNEAIAIAPDFLVVDSIQTLLSNDSESRIGSTTQSTEVATVFTNYAKHNNVPTILIGHMTKDANTIAGANAVQHLVDVVMVFEQSNDSPLRMLRASKNRHGSTDELGCFQHGEAGLEEVSDPSNLFMDEHAEGTTGFAISMTAEGRRTFPIEIQALVSPTKLPNPRKISSGVEHGRCLQIQAVTEKSLGLRLFDQDVYASSVGGLRVNDPSTDLALVAALISSQQDRPLSAKTCFLGEVTLTGEIRSPRDRERKLKEASRLFDTIYTTPGKTYPGDVKVIFVKTVKDLGEHLKRIKKVETPSLDYEEDED